jgi:hypothetical protein
MSTSYATLAATVSALRDIGFTMSHESVQTCVLDSQGKDRYGAPVAVAEVYQCSNGYYCVSVHGDWQAPVTWSGPTASWDDSNPLHEFANFRNQHYAGWK